MLLKSLLFFLFCLSLSFSLSNRTVLIGPGFWNIRASFILNNFDIGTQMSLIQLNNGRFLILDTVELDQELKSDIDELTKSGSLVDAVIATHPFHTVYFPPFYTAYPKLKYYGTPRHLRMQTQIPWAGNMYNCSSREKWLPEVHMRIPRGSEFEQPQETVHFSGIHVFHQRSKTIHVDDTIMYNLPKAGEMFFHPTLLRGNGLYNIPESPKVFKAWVQNMINQWSFDNICAAHNGVKKGALSKLRTLLLITQPLFDVLEKNYTKSPSAQDAALFKTMQSHESKCRE